MVENKITVLDLVNACSKLSSVKARNELIKSKVKVKNYIDYGTKCFIADNIIKTSSKKNGFINVNSCKRYILYVYSLISNYTNIYIEEKNLMTDYDLLDSNGLLEDILELIPEKEQKTFGTVLKMKQDDFMTNNYEIHAYINNIAKNVIPVVAEELLPLLSSLNDFVQGLDEKKVLDIIKKVDKLKK